MRRARGRRWWGLAALVLLCIVALAFWQWQTLARLVIVAGAERIAHVRLAYRDAMLGTDRAVFNDVRVTSLRGEPIADVARVALMYDLREMLFGGGRLFGLKSLELDTPRVTVIRRPDGSYNIPLPSAQPSPHASAPPLIARGRIRDGSVDVIDDSRNALPNLRRLYLRDVQADADIAIGASSRYAVDFRYGQRDDRLYPVRGRGRINRDAIDQHWTASTIPIAAAADFIVNSSTIALHSGVLRDLDARYVGLPDQSGAMQTHLAASAYLDGARISIAGLSKPVDGVRGPINVYGNGLLTPRLDASIAGVPARVSGGIYGLNAPRVQLAVRGNGDLSRLRTAFAQAARLPVRGTLTFALLVDGPATKPFTWIALRSTGVTYASAAVSDLHGLVAFDGREADIVRFNGRYQGAALSARGRAGLKRAPNAIEMLAGVRTSLGAIPYANVLLPGVSVTGLALARADDPKAIALRGVLWGAGPGQRLDATFDVDSRGVGSIGPLHLSGDRGSLYARVALDRPHDTLLALIDARDIRVLPAQPTVNATVIAGETKGRLHGAAVGTAGSEASFGATVAGTPGSPQAGGTLVVAGGRYRDFAINGNAGLEYAGGSLSVHDAAAAIGPIFVAAAGTIAPRYDLAAQLHSSDVHQLLATVRPREAALVQGSVDADVRVRGQGSAPLVSGTIRAPEGSINGLAFRDFQGDLQGGTTAFALTNGHVVVGSSPIALSGNATLRSAGVEVSAPQLDLADFNDFFDTGDMLAGTGSLALRATLHGTQIVSSSGSAAFTNARFRSIALGSVAANWESRGRDIASALHFGGPSGEFAVTGSVEPAAMRADLQANAHAVDLGMWLPMLGLHAPVTGRLDAQATLTGSYPDVAMQIHAAVFGGTAGGFTVERFQLDASAVHGRGTIERAIVELPALATTVSGGFGLRPSDSLSLVANTTSTNIGDVLTEATGKHYAVSGTLSSQLRVTGTVVRPRVSDTLALGTFRYGNLAVPRIAADIEADRNSVAVRNGEVDLAKGKALFGAAVPIRITRSGVEPAPGPISGSVNAQDIELSNFADMLPKGTQLNGRIDGAANAGGTVATPQVSGSLALRDGNFSGPMEKTPITNIVADLTFEGSDVQLKSTASAGGGSLSAQATALFADLHRPADAAFTLAVRAANARVNLPAYFEGDLNADVSVARTRASAPKVGGSVAISNARIPLNAFLNQKGGGQAAPHLPVAFDNLKISAGDNVRVQSANVDIGASGSATLGGTLSAPTLAGTFTSTGGSLNFYRNFNLERGSVTFDPSSGIIPNVDAVATTFVSNPPTAIRLNVTGPATNMNLALASEPSYNREQILGLLLGMQQFGAVQGVQSGGGQGFSAGSAIANVGLGQLNTLFTRNLLEPISGSVARSLGFTTVAITSDIQTGLGLSATKTFGRNINAVFSQTFGYPRTQAVTLEGYLSEANSLRFTWYTSSGPTLFAQPPGQAVGMDVLNLNRYTALPPATGTNGYQFSFLRKWW
jgi:autotransporter translocation and assembly factor TamB